MSSLEEHDAEQAAITALCDSGQCDHPDCKPGRIKYVCPSCKEESLYHSDDVTLYWDTDAQQWAISDDGHPRDDSNLYCGNCDEICEASEAKQEA